MNNSTTAGNKDSTKAELVVELVQGQLSPHQTLLQLTDKQRVVTQQKVDAGHQRLVHEAVLRGRVLAPSHHRGVIRGQWQQPLDQRLKAGVDVLVQAEGDLLRLPRLQRDDVVPGVPK